MELHHVHFYVEDAIITRDWFIHYLGFQSVASAQSQHTCTEVVKSGQVCFVLSSARLPSSPVQTYLQRHAVGISDVAFCVHQIESVVEKAVRHGATLLQPIQEQKSEQFRVKWAKIAGWGDLTHTLIEYPENLSVFSPEFFSFLATKDGQTSKKMGDEAVKALIKPSPNLYLSGIDHAVLNVPVGELVIAQRWYEKILGFQSEQTFNIHTERSGLYSQVMVHPAGTVKFPINEPSCETSQIQEFLDLNGGAGIQHIALRTENILQTVQQLRKRDLPFLDVPSAYYTERRQELEINLTAAEWDEVERSQILVDWQTENSSAILLQIFTQPIFAEPTFFFEFIERRSQAQGFGAGNFQALFEAIEREQLKRNFN